MSAELKDELLEAIVLNLNPVQAKMVMLEGRIDALEVYCRQHKFNLPSVGQLNKIVDGQLKKDYDKNEIAQFWFDQATSLKNRLVHLEKCLADKNLKLIDVQQRYQDIEKKCGEKSRKLDAVTNDLQAAIANDRISSEKLHKLQKICLERGLIVCL